MKGPYSRREATSLYAEIRDRGLKHAEHRYILVCVARALYRASYALMAVGEALEIKQASIS